ncbi:SpaA isopeptide-forming pilin-related protein [Paraliobacillus salinarum]|uniref:SpaA isopeptide-forming pilin-related protein n=1 Tax=Paraliobacillus salinarum TaxID=1158996 RepID=UPI0015F6B5E3|nr:SpaA isopeptide-forming pilin-related protein [Paraliobacillus salinarum]
MKKNASLFLVFLILLQTITSSVVSPQITQAKEMEGTIFKEVTVMDGEEGQFLQVNWSIVDQLVEANDSYTLEAPIDIEPNNGAVTYERTDIGNYETKNNMITFTFNEEVIKNPDAHGVLDLKVVGSSQDQQNDGVETSEEDKSTQNKDLNVTKESRDSDLEKNKKVTEVVKTQVTNQVISESIIDDVTLKIQKKDSEPQIVNPNEVINVVAPFEEFKAIFNYEFSLPDNHSYTGGSSYTIDLPEFLTVSPNPDPIPLTNELGVEFGSFVVTNDNKIVITFNEEIENNSNVVGWIELESLFDEHFAEEADQQISIPVKGEGSIDFPVRFQPSVNGIDKRVQNVDRPYNTETITWEVDFNKSLEDIQNGILKDNLSAGQSFVPGSLKVYKLTMNADGTVASVGEEITDHTFGDQFDLQLGNISDAYRIVYDTAVDPDDTATKYKNTALLSGDNLEEISATASQTVKRGKPLEKSNSNYNGVEQTIDWEIKYNFNQKNIQQANAHIKDIFGQNQELKGDVAVYYASIDPNTGEATKGDPVPAGNYTFTPVQENVDSELRNGFKINMNSDIEGQPFIIDYQTTVSDRVESDFSVTNKVVDGNNNEVTSTGNIKQGVLIKTGKAADYKAKTKDWSISLNKDQYEMNNLIIEDTMPDGFTPRVDDIVIKHGGTLLSNAEYEATFDQASKAFKITFLTQITKRVDISYTTDIDFDVAGYGASYKNIVDATWQTTDNIDQTQTGSATFDPGSYTKENGFKGGTYNVVNKTVTWEIGINYNDTTLVNPVVRDIIEKNQNFDINTVKVYAMNRGSEANSFTRGEEIDSSQYDIIEVVENGQPGFEVHFKNTITEAYLIEFETDLNGEMVEGTYNNTATIKDDTGQQFDLTGTVSPHEGGTLVDKSANQNNDNPRIVNWTVDINFSQSKVNDVEITDTLGVNQSLYPDSFVIYGTKVENNKIVKDLSTKLSEGTDYTIEYTQTEDQRDRFVLEFVNSVEKGYVLEYDSRIMFVDDTNKNITNEIKLGGITAEGFKHSDSVNKAIDMSSIGGGIDGNVGSLIVTKVNKDDSSEKLSGATFELWNADNTEFIKKETTGADGTVTFNKLIYGDYILKETNAPEGYVVGINDQQIVKVDADTINETITNAKIIRDVELIKTDAETGEALQGVIFELQDENDEVVPGYESLETDENGKIKISNLEPGNYRFVETKPLFGYENMDKSVSFTIETDQTKVLEKTAKNNIILGSVELTKVDADNNNAPLAGAEFNLVDDQGNNVIRDKSDIFTTNEHGKIVVNDLRPGTYKFIETKAPEHYQLDSTPIEVVVVKGQTETATKVANNKLITGSVRLEKLGEDGKPLEGVTFEIQDQEGNTIFDNLKTNKDGKLEKVGLSPGKYQFVETASIPGYELNPDVKKFEIVKSQTESQISTIDFTNELTPGSVQLTKVGEEEETLEGAVFKLVNDTGEDLQTGLTTNENGVIVVNNLKPGDYQFIETKAPFGHDLDQKPVDFTIEFNQQEIKEVSKVNERSVSSVELTKIGEGGDALAGVTFDLLSDKGEEVETGLTTNDEGKIVVNNLKPGSYQFVEKASIPGYQLDEIPTSFKIELGQTESTLVEITNEWTTGSASLTKFGEEGETLEGAVYQLTDEEGNELAKDLVTNEAGVLVIDELKPGNYQLIETTAPFGHELDATPLPFTIAFNQQEVLELEHENARSTNAVEVMKKGEDGVPLEGVVFDLVDAEGTVLQADIRTDKNGRFSISKLKPGDYQLVEIKTVNGYVLNEEPVSFEIELGQTDPTLIEITNELSTGSVRITKVNMNGEVLAGAVFELRNSDGETLQRDLTTNSDGELTITDLKPGKYQLVETKAPSGYQLDETPIPFTIEKGQKEILELEVQNKKIPESNELPNTATNMFNFMLIGLVMLLLSFAIYMVANRRTKKE